jgi:hypothetical protein
MTNSNIPHQLPSEVLAPIRHSVLFYPCSGQDLNAPIKLFAPAVSSFIFVDIRRPRRPDLAGFARPLSKPRQAGGPDEFVHTDSGHEFRLHRIRNRAEEILDELPEIGVFFFRGDNPVNGEGSSGVLWLGGILFSRVLRLLIPGGLVVTDGSNPGPGGPSHLSDFYHNRNVRDSAMSAARAFEYEGRHFRCVGYVGEKNGPTLVWQVK